MPLGQRLYQSLLYDEPEVLTVVPERKGRSEALKAKQNELIICRYYYYIKIEERQYERTLELLEDQIYLSQRTIINIINENSAMLRNLHNNKPNVKYFRSKYPHIIWKDKAN